MTTHIWRGDAPVVAQVTTITVADTWATGDTATLTINGKTLTLTVGTDATNAQIATALKEMVNGETQTGSGDHDFSDTGDNIPEFSELTATASSSTLTLTGPSSGDMAGAPFTVTAGETTAGDGTLGSPTEATAASSPHSWIATNFDSGSLPSAGDTVYVLDSDASIKWNLDQGSAGDLTAIHVAAGFTGDIGLPKINATGATSYNEYRKRDLDINVSTLTIGKGSGSGSGRLQFDLDALQTAITIYSTGSSSEDDQHAVTLRNTGSSSTLTIYGGSVDVAPHAAETATLATIKATGQSTVRCSSGVTLTTVQADGSADIDLDCAATTITMRDQPQVVKRSGTTTTANVYGGTLDYHSSGTITNLNLGSAGNFTLENNVDGVTITNCAVEAGCTLRDPLGRGTYSNGINPGNARISDITLELGAAVVVTPA